jgi:ABC-type Fe3+-siderophore transport system permease subunit
MFQSSQATDIAAHFSDRERKQMGRLCLRNMVVVIGSMCVGSALFRWYFNLRWAHELIKDELQTLLPAIVVFLLLLPWSTLSMKVFLASTEYAKAKGITVENLRLFAFAKNHQ